MYLVVLACSARKRVPIKGYQGSVVRTYAVVCSPYLPWLVPRNTLLRMYAVHTEYFVGTPNRCTPTFVRRAAGVEEPYEYGRPINKRLGILCTE